MIDRKLVRYINGALLQGHNLEDIKKHLILHGHSNNNICRAIDACHKLFEKKRTSKKGIFYV